ncbi:MAG: SpoIIE family protein phosphatase [Gemmatimonadota bacterium]|nr:SpoIIE family protein phosphatase [Gemmatimonadota bacterium]
MPKLSRHLKTKLKRLLLLLPVLLTGLINPLPCPADEPPEAIESLERENMLLKERLSRLEAHRESFRWTRFTGSPLLLTGTVMQMGKLTDGRLAFATAGQGAVLFDGTAFEVIDSRNSGLLDDFVTAIVPYQQDDGFCIASAAGVQHYIDRDGSLADYRGLAEQLEGAPVSCLAALNGDAIWVGTQGRGLCHLGTDSWRIFSVADSTPGGLTSNDISCLALDSTAKSIWIGTAGGGICSLTGNSWQKFEQPLGPGSEDIYCLTICSDGQVWVGTAGAGAGFWDGSNWKKVTLPDQAGPAVVSITELERSDLLFGTDEGAFLMSGEDRSIEAVLFPEELAPYPVVSAMESYSLVWLSPSGQGLHLYDRAGVVSFSRDDGLPDNNIYHLAQSPDARIWCSTWNGTGIYDGRGWTSIDRRHGLPNALTTYVLFAGEDTTYFGTHSGVARLSSGGWDIFSRDNGLASNTVNHLARDTRGRLWISTEGGGLAVLDERDSLSLFGKAHGLPADEVQVSAPSGSGDTVWVGTRKGLSMLVRDRVFPFAEKAAGESMEPAPGPEEHITALKLTRDGCLWAATLGHGLWRRDPAGQWRQFTMEQGLSSNTVFAITGDKDGFLYFGTSMGLSVFDGSHFRSYSAAADGLPAGAIKSVLPAEDKNGKKLWLAVEDRGLTRFDTGRIERPETFIRTSAGLLVTCDTGGRPHRLAAEDNTLPADTSRLPGGRRLVIAGAWYNQAGNIPAIDTVATGDITVQCLGLTPWRPSPATGFRFSYRLDKGPWSEFSYQSVISLYGLARGSHTLNVRAKGPHLKVDPTPAVLELFVNVPTIWSDWRTWAGIAAVLLLTAAIIFRKVLAWYLGVFRHRSFKPITPNPFKPDEPSAGREYFFGRDQALEAISGALGEQEAGNQALIVQGDEKIGISSLLLQAAGNVSERGGIPVYVDLGRSYFPDSVSLLESLAARLVDKDPAAGGEDGRDAQEILGDLLAAVGARPVVFLFDNAEVLGRILQRDTEHGPKTTSFFRDILLSESGGASLILGLHDLEDFRQACGVLYNVSRILRLSPVDEGSALKIISSPLAGKTLLHDQAASLVANLSNGEPYLAHHLGHALVEQVNRERTNLVTHSLAERAVEFLVASPPEELLDRWENLGKTEKLLLASALDTGGGKQDAVTVSIQEVGVALATMNISLVQEELAKAAASLADRGMVALESPGSGRFTVGDSLLNRWIAASQPVELVSARQEYDFGSVVRKTGEELGRSFKVQEIGERVLACLSTPLHFGWGVLLYVVQDGESQKEDQGGQESAASVLRLECASVLGAGVEASSLPAQISSSAASALSASPEALICGSPVDDMARAALAELHLEEGTAVVPLQARGGLVGILAAGPRPGGERYLRRDRMLLDTIGEQAAVAIENARLYEQETEKERMKQELETARHMQMSILPARKPQVPGLDFYAFLTPATEVGGDYFDYRLIDERTFMFLVGDVSGHGISAGTLVSMSKSCIYNQVKTSYEVDKVMAAMNDMVHGAMAERLLMTFCYTIFDLEKRTIRYSIAGHPFPYHYHAASGQMDELELSAYPLGVTSRARYSQAETPYSPGDVLVFYSDGLPEGADPEGEQLGFERFEEMILNNKHLSAEQINSNIIKEFRTFARGAPQDDDITLVVIKALEK